MLDCCLRRIAPIFPEPRPPVFRPNDAHRQQNLFGVETQLSPALWKRLQGSKEYAFYPLASGYKSKSCNWLHVDSSGFCDFAAENTCDSSIF